MRYVQSFRLVVAALALGLAVGVAAPVLAQITEDNVAEMVQKATTAADHTALADYFRAQAKKAEDNAHKHRAMLDVGGAGAKVFAPGLGLALQPPDQELPV